MEPRVVAIHYRRLPSEVQIFEQVVLDESPSHTVTLLESAELADALDVEGSTILEPGSPVVWFTYPGEWHDVGRFHLADGTFTGIYANLLTPVKMHGDRWETTDLVLDVWVGADGGVTILDEDEFTDALRHGWIDAQTAHKVRAHAQGLARAAERGTWPPPHVHGWTLERARRTLAGSARER